MNTMVLLGICCLAGIWPSMSKLWSRRQFGIWFKFQLIEVAETGVYSGNLLTPKGLEQLLRSAPLSRLSHRPHDECLRQQKFCPDYAFCFWIACSRILCRQWKSSSLKGSMWVPSCVGHVWSYCIKIFPEDRRRSITTDEPQRLQPASPQKE